MKKIVRLTENDLTRIVKRILNEENNIKLNDPSITIEKSKINSDIINTNKTLLKSILDVKPTIDLKNINVNDSDFMSKITDTLDNQGIDMFVRYTKSKGLNIVTSISIPKLNNLSLNLSGNYIGFTFRKNF